MPGPPRPSVTAAAAMESTLALLPQARAKARAKAKAKAKARGIEELIPRPLHDSWHRSVVAKVRRMSKLAGDAVCDPMAALDLKRELDELETMVTSQDAVEESVAFLARRVAAKRAADTGTLAAAAKKKHKDLACARAKKSREKRAAALAERGVDPNMVLAVERSDQRRAKKEKAKTATAKAKA